MRQSRGAPRAAHFRGTPRSLTRGPRGASGQPTAAVRSPRPPGGEVGPAQLSGDRGWRPAALEAGAGPFNRATGQRVQEPLWRPPHTHTPQSTSCFPWPLCPPSPPTSPSCSPPPALHRSRRGDGGESLRGPDDLRLLQTEQKQQGPGSPSPGRPDPGTGPGISTRVPVPSAVRRPWERTPLPRRFGVGGRRRGPAGPRLRPHAPRYGPSARARSCWGAPEAGCSCSEPGEGRAENSPG